jgi:anti-sigma factor (TIGR02949 family)
MSMTCRELFERLSEYVDGELSQELCEEIRKHMDGCDPCVNFAKTLKTTAELCRRLPSQPIPPEVAVDLRSFLSDHMPKSK